MHGQFLARGRAYIYAQVAILYRTRYSIGWTRYTIIAACVHRRRREQDGPDSTDCCTGPARSWPSPVGIELVPWHYTMRTWSWRGQDFQSPGRNRAASMQRWHIGGRGSLDRPLSGATGSAAATSWTDVMLSRQASRHPHRGSLVTDPYRSLQLLWPGGLAHQRRDQAEISRGLAAASQRLNVRRCYLSMRMARAPTHARHGSSPHRSQKSSKSGASHRPRRRRRWCHRATEPCAARARCGPSARPA